jgi:transitional endoplasmic reticulum ATPase
VSFTNELLTQMERFCGMLICTTNRLEGLDPAALRRFQVKLRLGYLRADGKQLLYRSLLAPLCPSPTRPAHLRALRAVDPLAPGDFSVVRDRYATEQPDHAELLAALEQQVALRRAQGRVAGFAR